MADALAASDLAIMRAGASVLGELPAARLPAILVPGEYEGWDQSANARYLEEQGAAVMLRQNEIDHLHDLVRDAPRRHHPPRRHEGGPRNLSPPQRRRRDCRPSSLHAGVKTRAPA